MGCAQQDLTKQNHRALKRGKRESGFPGRRMATGLSFKREELKKT